MCVASDKDDLIVRCEPEETEKLLARKGVREFRLVRWPTIKVGSSSGPDANRDGRGL